MMLWLRLGRASRIRNRQSTIRNPLMSFSFENSRILLTGGTGHTGRRLAQRLLERGVLLRCLSHNPARRVLLPESSRIEIVEGSAKSPDDIARAAEGIRTVLHLAHIRFADTVVEGLSRRTDPIRLIVMSSTRMMSDFHTEIREVVREGEEAVKAAPPNIQWTILRPSMIFGGPDDHNIERLAAALRRWPVFPLFGDGQNLVQPLFVWDLVAAIQACLERPETIGRTYVLAGPEPMPYRRMVSEVARAQGRRAPFFIRIPRSPAVLFAELLRMVWPRCPLDPEAIERFGEDRNFNTHPAQRDLGFAPTPFEQALGRKFRREV
jgi:nucleoside-diphosphate-sugar epimerase